MVRLDEGCKYNAASHGYCWNHQRKRTDKKWLATLEKQKAKRSTPIKVKPKPPKPKPVSLKKIRYYSKTRAAEYRQYAIDRKAYFEKPENYYCQMYPHLQATTIHHAKGKIGKLLLDQRWWIRLSIEAHMWAEGNPDEAKAIGLSLSRLAKEQNDADENSPEED